MKGYTANATIGQHLSLRFSPEDRERGLAEAELAAASRGEYKDGVRRRGDGRRSEAAVLTALWDVKHGPSAISRHAYADPRSSKICWT